MTALQSDANVAVRPALRAVRAGERKAGERKAAVRPDRPAEASRLLRAVPTPGSADVAFVRPSRPVRQIRQVARTSASRAAGSGRPVRIARWAQAGTWAVRQDRATRAVVVRRQRIILALGIAAAAIFAFALGIFLYAALGLGLQAGGVTTVMAGDSLWSIASAMGTGLPTERVVHDIMALNALDGTHIAAGSQLLLPSY